MNPQFYIQIDGSMYPDGQMNVRVYDQMTGRYYGSVAGRINAINIAAVLQAVRDALSAVAEARMMSQPEPSWTGRSGGSSRREPEQRGAPDAIEAAYRMLTEGER